MATACTGCMQTAQFWAGMTGGDWIEPEFVLTRGRLLVLIDDFDDLVTQPRAVEEVHKTVSANLLKMLINDQVIPYKDWQELRQNTKDYDKLSIRAVGEKLGAEQVLYLRVTRFALSDEPGAEIYRGRFEVRVKVVTTQQIRNARLWPEREDLGRKVVGTTEPEPMDGDRSAFEVTRELSIKLGQAVTKLFYGHRELDD